VLLVDDVIYSGRTFLKAVTHLDAAGAEAIHLAALCSRGENEVPVYADFVAMQIDVGEGNVIEVHAPPFEEEWGVWLFHREDLAED
jgi:pyrimidine operon attenuation protein/uracil phosphoribosyltransferase